MSGLTMPTFDFPYCATTASQITASADVASIDTAINTAPTRQARVTSSSFAYDLDFKQIDFRQSPQLYRVGRGEQGVLLVEPYKSEILPHWRFKNPEVARLSADTIFALFHDYLAADDFVGADMARKFLQMGFTRARRYANHQGGKKYQGPVPMDQKGLSGAHGREELPRINDPVKAEAARIFKQKWDQAEANPQYQAEKAAFKARFG
jgi:hypothetical protein